MKKFIVSLMSAFIMSVPAVFAQTEVDEIFDAGDANHPYMGIRVGFESPLPSDVKNGAIKVDVYKNGIGLNGGVIYNIPLWKNLYFEPGASLFYNAFGTNAIYMDDDEDYNGSVRRFGLRIPVQLGYHFDFDFCKFYVYTGPELEFGLIGRAHSSMKVGGVTQSESENIYKKDGLSRTDIGWKLGVGASVDRYYLGLSGNIGMRNLVRANDGSSMHCNLFQLTLGYNL